MNPNNYASTNIPKAFKARSEQMLETARNLHQLYIGIFGVDDVWLRVQTAIEKAISSTDENAKRKFGFKGDIL